jgi:flagellar hook-associated protein 1 FlgK
MSLSQALASAISGLKVNQSSLALVAANVANSDTPGYVRKTVNQVAIAGNGTGIGVRITAVQRELDQYVQRQLRTENAGASYADTRAQMYSRLQDIYGTPGSSNALDTVYNNFTTALQSLSTSPDDPAARSAVISSAQLLTQQLNQMSSSVQSLRGDAELGISDAVTQANTAMSQIASLNQQITGSTANDSETASLMDQRDTYVDQLSQLMDINVVQGDNNQISIYTNSGVQLVGSQAAKLSFDAQGTMTATSTWSADPTKRTVGTITLTSPTGNAVDLVQTSAIRSGTIAAYLQMRDQDLVQAQSQLDAMAASMSSALSDQTTAGTPATVGPQSGFDVDIGGLQAGNTVTVNYTDSLTNTPRTMTLVRVNDSSALPLSNNVTTTPNDKVVGIDFSGGMGSVLAQINSAIASTGMVASNPSGNVLRVLNDGAGNIVTVNSVSATATATSLSGGSSQLPFFADGSVPYTGALSALGSQSIGYAGRIAVNGALAADPSKLVVYASGVAAGDSTRPNFIQQQLTSSTQLFSPNTGIGTTSAPFSGSIPTFLRQVLSQQGEAANSANNLKQGQDVVLNSLQQRFNDSSGVNVDQEMTNLLTLQNSYAANARVLTAVNQMFQTLLQM